MLSAEHTILSEARDQLVDGTPWLAMRLSEDILANHLRPAMETLLETLRSKADLAATVPWGDTRALLRASDDARAYHEEMVLAAEHYAGIRDAQWRLKLLTGSPSDDAYSHFGQLRNMDQIWPDRGNWTDGRAPWPEDPIARMAWLVTSEADPWMPTAAECEAALADRLSGVTVVRGLAVPTR